MSKVAREYCVTHGDLTLDDAGNRFECQECLDAQLAKQARQQPAKAPTKKVKRQQSHAEMSGLWEEFYDVGFDPSFNPSERSLTFKADEARKLLAYVKEALASRVPS